MKDTEKSLPDELIGQGATTHYGSDCYAYTIADVVRIKSGTRKGQVKSLGLRRDICTAVGGTWPDVEYSFASDPTAQIEWYSVGAKNSTSISIGHRREYRDPHV
jgi:hypothetical protein